MSQRLRIFMGFAAFFVAKKDRYIFKVGIYHL
ncbi:hypothetical protein M089_4707, partial [Bacteroides ovatus str. 3725 D9 iii]